MRLGKKVFIFLSSILLFLCAYLFINYLIDRTAYTKKLAALRQDIEKSIRVFPGRVGIIVEDLSGRGWKMAFNEDAVFPAASIIKLPIACSVFMGVDKGLWNLDKEYYLKQRLKTAGSGILKYLPAGKKFSLKELLMYMLSYSDNTATNMLIDILGFERINKCFKTLGLRDTVLKRKMMDFSARRMGLENTTSCRDIALLLEKIYKKQFLNYYFSSRMLSLLLRQHSRDRLPKRLPKSVPVAHKTGLEKGVVHDAGIVFSPRGNYLICVCTGNVKHYSRAKEFIAQVCRRVFNFLLNL